MIESMIMEFPIFLIPTLKNHHYILVLYLIVIWFHSNKYMLGWLLPFWAR